MKSAILVVPLLLFAPLAIASVEPTAPALRIEDGLTRDAYGVLSEPSSASAESIAAGFLAAHHAQLGLPDGFALAPVATKRSLTATHHRFQQTWDGLAVVGGDVSVHVRHDGVVVAVHSRAVPVALPIASPISSAQALLAAREAAPGAPDAAPRLVYLAQADVAVPAWEVSLLDPLPLSAPLVHVDARDGTVLSVVDRVDAAVAQARIWVNPIVESGNADLRDHRFGVEKFDDPTPTGTLGSRDFTPFLREVQLEGLEEGPFGATLVGPRVRLMDALASGDDMRYAREDPRFEEVMAYFWMNWTQATLTEIGFPDLMAYQIPVYAHDQPGLFNAFYRRNGDGTGEIHFGWHAPVVSRTGLPGAAVAIPGIPVASSFADSSEDGEVVVHEYGHAVLDNAAPNFNGGHMHEGFADFFAATMLSRVSNGTFDWCIAEWFTSYLGTTSGGRPPCLRTLDNDLTTDYPGVGHALGQVWSGALWNIRKDMGDAAGEKLVLEAIHLLPVRGSFQEGAEALLVADASLNGADNARIIYEEFHARNVTGIVVTPDILSALVAGAPAGVEPLAETRAVPATLALAVAAGALAAARARRRD